MRIVSLDPVVVALLAVACALYLRALRVLARRRPRGITVPAWQQACWWVGVALLAVGLLGPPDAYDDVVLSAHMAQHQLLGDLAAPFLLMGLRSPVLLFYLPRPVLVALARRRRLRGAFRLLRQPLVALPVYAATVYVWHWSPLFEGAVESPLLHALQHESFLAANLLLWWPVVEPARRRMSGQLWKIGYLFAARMSTMFLGMVFVFTRGILYVDAYGAGPREGIAARSDQQTAGGLMITLDIVIMVVAVSWLFWLAARDADDGEARTDAGGRGDANERVGGTDGPPGDRARAGERVRGTDADLPPKARGTRAAI